MKSKKITKSAVLGRRYSSIESMLIGEKFPKRIINKVRALMDRDKAIAHAFRQGTSMKRLARKHSLPLLAIEDVLRYELALHSHNNPTTKLTHGQINYEREIETEAQASTA